MAKKKQFTASIPVQFSQDWRDRVAAVADHELVNDSMAAIVRDCVEQYLPFLEQQLGLGPQQEVIDALDEVAPPTIDRSAGCFGGPPLPE